MWFGFSRSYWYSLDASGAVPFVRVRRPGNQRGAILIPYQKAADYFHGLTKQRPSVAAVPQVGGVS
jgi:hypothetical protein